MSDIRERFEDWIRSLGRGHQLALDTPHGWYKDLTITTAWTAWQVAEQRAFELAVDAVPIVMNHESYKATIKAIRALNPESSEKEES